MAKKKDATGLAGIVKNVPRKVDIKGQSHMLAWITPKEGETLQALGGSGMPGPMGIPAYYDPGGTADPGQAAEGGFSDSFGGYDGPSNSDDNDRGYTDGTTNTRSGTGTTDEDEDQDREQDKALADFLSGKEDRNWVEQMMIDKVKKGEELTSYEYDPKTDRYTGFEQKAKPGLSGLSNIMAMISENIFGVTPSVYTGFGKKAGFDDIVFDDGGRDITMSTQAQGTAPAADSSVGVTSPDSYYASGIGTATLDLNDPVQRELYFRRLYGETPSPIGREYKSAFNLKDLKNRKRMRGLDIFKPVSIV